MEQRLQKIIAASGITARRKAEELIRNGRVSVNGKVVTQLGTKADPTTDKIVLDGEVLTKAGYVYYLFHKPTGIVTTLGDGKGKKTLTSYLRKINVRVFPVGRLDEESAGLLLLTNDGALANKLMHPKHKIQKLYRVTVSGKLSDKAKQSLERGLKLKEAQTGKAVISEVIFRSSPKTTIFTMAINEGRNRQIRRMCGMLGYPVTALQRVAIGPLVLGDLKVGSVRRLTTAELTRLKQSVLEH